MGGLAEALRESLLLKAPFQRIANGSLITKADSITYTVPHIPCKRPLNQQLEICNVKGGKIEVSSSWLKLLPCSQISHNAQFTQPTARFAHNWQESVRLPSTIKPFFISCHQSHGKCVLKSEYCPLQTSLVLSCSTYMFREVQHLHFSNFIFLVSSSSCVRSNHFRWNSPTGFAACRP